MKQKKSFVYFDIGGVAIKDFSETNKWELMKRDLGITPELDQEFEGIWNEYAGRICLDYDVDNLVPIIRERLKIPIPDNYSMLNDFIQRFEPNKSLWPVINKCRYFAKVGLLTNMYPRMYGEIQKAKLLPPLTWDEIVDSSVVGMEKPNPEIFKLAEAKAGVKANEILFVENTQKHIDVAKELGWQTFWYDSKDYEKSSQELNRMIDDIG